MQTLINWSTFAETQNHKWNPKKSRLERAWWVGSWGKSWNQRWAGLDANGRGLELSVVSALCSAVCGRLLSPCNPGCAGHRATKGVAEGPPRATKGALRGCRGAPKGTDEPPRRKYVTKQGRKVGERRIQWCRNYEEEIGRIEIILLSCYSGLKSNMFILGSVS